LCIFGQAGPARVAAIDISASGGGRDEPVVFPGAAVIACLPVLLESFFGKSIPPVKERSTDNPDRRDAPALPPEVE
jgi:hypothetical protein